MSFYTEAVERNLEGLSHVSVGPLYCCRKCRDLWCPSDNKEPEDEGSFSCAPCDTCGSVLGGLRYAAHGRLGKRRISSSLDVKDRIVHLEVCVDCVQFLANGTEKGESES